MQFYVNKDFRSFAESQEIMFLRDSLFVCNRGDTIQYHGGLQHLRKLGQTPMLHVFLTPRPALSSHQHRTLVCLFLIWEPTLCSQWNSKSHYCSPRVLRAAGCIQQPKSLFLRHLAISGFPQSDLTVSKLSADADSLWNTVKQASRPQAILKTPPPICLDYRASNRPQLINLCR